jgi:hypothetical protein
MSYDVILSSSFCKDEYPDNHGCEFTNRLNQQLDLDQPNESWSVALREITYEPDFWQNVREGFNECDIRIGQFDCYVSDFKMIEAEELLINKPKFTDNPHEPITAVAVLYHNNNYQDEDGNKLIKYPTRSFTVTKPHSFDIFGKIIDWTVFGENINYKSHFGYLIIDEVDFKRIWDTRPNTLLEKELLLGDSLALDLFSEKKDKQNLSPHEVYALGIYENHCQTWGMSKENDRTVEVKNDGVHITYRKVSNRRYYAWEGNKMVTVPEMIKSGYMYEYTTKQAFVDVERRKTEQGLTPKAKLRVAYYRHQHAIEQAETQQDFGWLQETQETTRPISREKRDDWLSRRQKEKGSGIVIRKKIKGLEVLNDYFFTYRTSKKFKYGPMLTKATFLELHYDNKNELMEMMNNRLNSAIKNALTEKFATEPYLESGVKYVHIYEDGSNKLKFTETEAAVSLKLDISLKLHITIQHMLGLTAYATIDLGWIALGNYTAKYILDLKKTPLSALWIFCDIVSHSYVKNLSLPLLRLSPVDRAARQISYESSANLQYKLLSTNNVQKIKIWIAEDYLGKPLVSNSDIFLNLHFVKNS